MKHFQANVIQEQVEATEELIVTLTENDTCQIETLIKSTADAMKKMMLLIKDNRNTSNSNNQTNEERKKKKDEKCRKYNDAPICKHCN